MDSAGLPPAQPPLNHQWCDSRHSPLITTVWPKTSPVEEIEAYYDVVAPWMESLTGPWGTVIDLSGFTASSSTAPQRRSFADRARRLSPLVQVHCVGIAAVMPSAVLRGIGTAVLWLVTPPVATEMFATRELADTWIQDRLRAAHNSGVAVSQPQ